MGNQILNQDAEAGDDDEQIKQDDDLDEYWHAWDENLGAQENPVLQYEQAKDLAESFVAHGEH